MIMCGRGFANRMPERFHFLLSLLQKAPRVEHKSLHVQQKEQKKITGSAIPSRPNAEDPGQHLSMDEAVLHEADYGSMGAVRTYNGTKLLSQEQKQTQRGACPCC